MSVLAIPPADVTTALSILIGWGGGVAPVYLDGRLKPVSYVEMSQPVRAGQALARRAARWDLEQSAQVELGLPEATRGNGGPGECSVLWCWAPSIDSVWRAAKRFRTPPTLVLKMGSSCRRLLIWGLKEQVPHVSVVAANKRIAYALHAPQTTAEPEQLRIPLAGTFLRVGRSRPVPVLVTCLEFGNIYTRSQVTATLKDPPPRDAWKERKA